MRNKAREDLILIALNRKYQQDAIRECSERHDGDLRFTAGDVVRICPGIIFHGKPSALDVFGWIEEHWRMDAKYIAKERKRLAGDWE